MVLITIWGIVAPLAMARKIDFLGFTSGIGMACMCLFTLIIMAYKFILSCPIKSDKRAQGFIESFATFENSNGTCAKENVFSEHAIHFHESVIIKDQQQCTPVAFTWNSQSVYAIPTMLFAFQCHASCLPVYTELKTPSRKNMLKVASTAVFAVWLIYSFVSFFSYFTFYNVTMEEVLMMYSSLDASEPLVLIARACCLICVIFSAPLLHYRKVYKKIKFWKTFQFQQFLRTFLSLPKSTNNPDLGRRRFRRKLQLAKARNYCFSQSRHCNSNRSIFSYNQHFIWLWWCCHCEFIGSNSSQFILLEIGGSKTRWKTILFMVVSLTFIFRSDIDGIQCLFVGNKQVRSLIYYRPTLIQNPIFHIMTCFSVFSSFPLHMVAIK